MLKIQDILRAQNIKRWTIIRTTRDQSLAEHTFNVVMIARAIAKRAKLRDEFIIKYALEHDLDEILTGDIPSPTKRRAFRLGLDLKLLECKGKNQPKNETTIQVVKAADLIENYWFLKEHGLGRHAEEERHLLLAVVAEYIDSLPDEIKSASWAVYQDVMTGEFFRHE